MRTDLLSRPRLVEKLNESVACRLYLLSASAGFGKTTLLSEWAAQNRRPTAWISLDTADNEPAQFLIYLISALRTLHEDFGGQMLERLQSSQSESFEAVLISLINEMATFPEDFTLILDDYHTITEPHTNELTAFLIDHLPVNMHLVIASRIDPLFPLARYRVRNQLAEIRDRDLRFNIEEAAEFLSRTLGFNLSVEDVKALEERTEGWIAGLQLAALSMQGRSDVSDFIRAFTGSHLYVAEYLVEEILDRQPQEIQTFLLQTSILERLNAVLCGAVCGCENAQATLTALQHANVFVVPQDNQGRWFRYHHLFADLLRVRLQQSFPGETVAVLHRRASVWYERNGYIDEAIRHALAGGDHDKAALLIDSAGWNMIAGDQYHKLDNWLAALPASVFQRYPRLQVYRFFIDLSRGTLDMFEETLLEKEKLIKSLPASPENDVLRRQAMVKLSIFYAHQNTARAIRIAQDALDDIPESDLKLRATLYSTFYRAYGMDGDIERSAPAYRECLRLGQTAGLYGIIADTTMVRAFDLCQYGRLDEAAEYCRQIIDMGRELKQDVFYPAGQAYIGLGGIHLERNELKKAEEALIRGLELSRQGAMSGLYTGTIQMSRLHQARGDYEQALKELHLLEQTLQRRDFTLTARQVSLRLAMGDIASASSLTAPLLEILGSSAYASQLPLIAMEAFKLNLIRIYIAEGKIESAAQLLDEIQTGIEAGKRFGRLLEVHLLRALLLQKRHDGSITAEAIDELVRALELAEGPGFVMLFLEEGTALIALLQAVIRLKTLPLHVQRYAQKLLNAFDDKGKTISVTAQEGTDALIEPLTPREMEVLRLMAAGDSNQTIAEKLVITVRTVKKHTSNIYSKLNADSRTQAVAYARKIGLLSDDQ